MEYAKTVFSQVAVMFILIFAGYVMSRFRMITDEGRKQMSSVVLNLVAPALIFMSYQIEFSKELLSGLSWAFVSSIITYIITIFLSYIIVRNKNGQDVSLERFSLVFTNCGFMGIPLINSLFGNEGVLYVTAYITLFHILSWTFGIMLIKNKFDFSEIMNAFKTPTMIAVILGIICYFARVKVPGIVGRALDFLGDMNTPLPMIIAGATMAQTDVLKAIRNLKTLILSFYRLFLIPIVCMLALKLFNIPEMVYTVTIIAAACPVATSLVLFSVKYNKDDKYSSELFSITTLLSIISLPIIVMLIKFI